MSEEQKQLIERAGWACVQHLEAADRMERAGYPAHAGIRRNAARKSSEFAFFLASLSVVRLS
jgi:hypothetical protein